MRKLLLSLLCCFPLLAGADGLPDLGDASQAELSPQQERQIGEQSMLQIRAEKSYLGDAEVNDYLNQLGYRLVSNSNDPSQTFSFFAINDNAINAFALPGGFIGVNTGLILTAQSESELAAVLAHEIAHVTQHHLARMVAGQKIDSLTSMAAIAVAILAARSNPQASQAAIVGAGASSVQRQLNYTRAHEQEADRIGLATLEKAGFDVQAMPTFFKRMERGTRLLDSNTPSWLLTHPVTSERIADIENRVRQLPYRQVADSLDFQLVRAKLLVTEKTPRIAIDYFQDALGPRKFGDPVVQRYGLTRALLLSGKTSDAANELATLRKQAPANDMIDTLSGKIYRTENISAAKLDAFYQDATQAYPQHRALAYDYADWLISEKRYTDALKQLDDRISSYPNDARLYELQARTYAAQGKHQEEHHALAYAYLLHGNLHGAIEQLQLAKQSGSDYYQLSIIESELKQFRKMAAANSKR
ncbi:MAG: M48 family metalloprotease [Sideroxydans sp.]|nr:M48 family metalloprotease [Sideroxydans sp.]